MELRPLGSHGPPISVVGYGGWEAGGAEWGPSPPGEQLLAAMRAGFEAGITWVDTAEIYGSGRSEELIGRAIQGRQQVMVFTTVASAPRGTGYHPDRIRGAAEESIGRLGRELHWLDERDVPLEETWGVMASLVDVGLARWIGVSKLHRRGDRAL